MLTMQHFFLVICNDEFHTINSANENLFDVCIRNFSDPSQIARNDDILRIFLLACDAKNAKLSVIGLSCLQKLIAHDAVAPSALPQILATLKEVSSPFVWTDLTTFDNPALFSLTSIWSRHLNNETMVMGNDLKLNLCT
ncbi:hypothetical protein O6H91_13G076800 [Diphasiastrum complanatum]|uniref:Uncharacterized protein n=1 Tax=Diphasiastrum complanatum TaxID=34168 RepID=A0ACC2BWC3_DIPCM|nr:hypothetical protein O6H91_13G076800 [Diphasiastrum complanatum]